MNERTHRFVKLLGILISMILLVILCVLFLKFNKINQEEKSTPVFIFKSKTNVERNINSEEQKPLTRDENDIPKSDYKVPEIG